MKHVSASEARRNWFKLLDEAARGEVIAIQRDDKQLVLRLHKHKKSIPNYGKVLCAPEADDADQWSWEWSPVKGVKPAKRR